jgi:hypothetical protein
MWSRKDKNKKIEIIMRERERGEGKEKHASLCFNFCCLWITSKLGG